MGIGLTRKSAKVAKLAGAEWGDKLQRGEKSKAGKSYVALMDDSVSMREMGDNGLRWGNLAPWFGAA